MPDRMGEERLNDIQARLAKAESGDDEELKAHAQTDIKDLLAEVQSHRQQFVQPRVGRTKGGGGEYKRSNI